ncbi:hypothetical protein ACF0H5_016036 [Mactra antiquata]
MIWLNLLLNKKEHLLYLQNQLNKPPPAAPRQNKDNNRLLYRGRANFNHYEDSSSQESSDSDSDVTSSSDSSDGGRKNRYHGNNGRKTVNNVIRNGFGAKTGRQIRANSAKGNNTTKREFHTQKNSVYGKFSPAGNLSGRSNKSESAINNQLTRKKIQNVTKVTSVEPLRNTKKKEAFISPTKSEVVPNIEKKEAFITPTKSEVVSTDEKKEAFISPTKSEIIPGSEKKENNEIKLNLTLPDSGLITLVRNELPLKPEDIVSARSIKTSTDTSSCPKHAFLSPVQSDTVNDIPAALENGSGVTKHVENVETESSEANSNNTDINKAADTKTNNNDFDIKPDNKTSVTQKISSVEREKVLKKYGIGSSPVLTNKATASKQTEKPPRPMKSVKSDSSIACGYFIEDTKEKSFLFDDLVVGKHADNTNIDSEPLVDFKNNGTELGSHSEHLNEMINMAEVNGNNHVDTQHEISENSVGIGKGKTTGKFKEYNGWKDEISSKEKFNNLFDKIEGSVIDGYSSSTSSRTLNRNDKGSKVLKEKTAKSFAKYANLTKDKSKDKTHGRKPRRINLKDHPSPGPKIPSTRTELKVVNTKPYGYDVKQKGFGPFHRTNVRTLNSAIDQTASELMLRSGSAEIPKITYRHKPLSQTPVRDPHTPES